MYSLFVFIIDHEMLVLFEHSHRDITQTRTLNVGEGTGITVGVDTISTNDAEINHDNLSGFEANEHIDHSSVSITAGDGLTGGGTIASNRTFAVGQGTGITVTADAISTNDAQINHDNLSGFEANEHIDHSGVSITAGKGLTGGGDITSSRTIDIDSANVRAMFSGGTGITYNNGTGEFTTTDGDIVHDNLSGFEANEHINHANVSITAGAGLTGGGDITSTKTLNVVGGDGITAKYGKNAMGSHAGQVNAEERWQIAQHVMELRSKLVK